MRTQDEISRDDIIEMARQAEMMPHSIYDFAIYVEELEAFAKLVEERTAAKEREACAKFAEDFLTNGRSPLGKSVGNAVRARGET